MNSDAEAHLDTLGLLLSEAHVEADEIVGSLARWQHGAALDIRDRISVLIRDCRGLRIAAGLGPPEGGP